MGTVATSSTKDFQIAPSGVHRSICYQVIDLGHQKVEYQGQPKVQHKVRFGWELSDEMMEDGRPFVVSRTFTLSLAESSHLRPFLESWRGRAFTLQELDGFDVKNVLSAPCLLNVIHNTANDGKTYANVAGASPLPKGMERPTMANAPLYFDIDRDDESVLPEWLQKMVKQAIERQEGKKETGSPFDDFKDDIPF